MTISTDGAFVTPSSRTTHPLILPVMCSVLIAALSIRWIWFWNGGIIVDGLLDGNRAAVYGALASVSAALLGFSITTIAIVLGLTGQPRIEAIKNQQAYIRLWHVFVRSIWTLGISTLVALIALVVDRDNNVSHVILVVGLTTWSFALVSVSQSIWYLQRLITAIALSG
jgi:hypothetical protein